jgi:YaiO family outer membrane protein
MTGIYRSAHWYDRALRRMIRVVRRPPPGVATLWVALAATIAVSIRPGRATAQGDPDQRVVAAAVKTLGVDYSYSTFAGDIDSWHLVAVSLGDRGPRGSIIGRANIANRFATNGIQYEVDVYPVLGAGTYAYLNFGYSGSTIFPAWRSGAELFRTLPRAYEASLGYRQLRFTGTPVTLFTGSVGRYTGNYWFSLRPFLRDKDKGLSASASLTARRYYADADNYVGARIGYGSTHSDEVVLSQLTRTSSSSASVTASRSASSRAITTWTVGFDREELSPSRFRNRWDLGVGLKIRF